MKASLGVVALCLFLASTALAQLPSPLPEEQFKSSGHKPLTGTQLREMLVGNTTYMTALENTPASHVGDVQVLYCVTRKRSSRFQLPLQASDTSLRFLGGSTATGLA
jgi:hypothetical protein